MQSIKKPTIAGFNEVVQTIKGMESKFPEQEHFISLVSFNGMGIREILFNQAVRELVEIDENKYHPGSSTPFFDAMGFSLTKQRDSIESAGPVNVLVTILTDGEESRHEGDVCQRKQCPRALQPEYPGQESIGQGFLQGG